MLFRSWVLPERDRWRRQGVAAAEALAEIALDCGHSRDAVEAATRGLAIDRYSDSLWRLLALARERNHDVVGAARARQLYADMLGELGLVPA